MATGIVSAAIERVGAVGAAGALLTIAVATFVVVLAASALRAVRYPADLAADLRQPSRSFTCFAFVAACDVLASDLAGDGHAGVAAGLVAGALVAWLVLTALVPGCLIARCLIARRHERPYPVTMSDINGTWYLWVVGAQSLAIATLAIATGGWIPTEPATLAAAAAWAAGIVGYLIVTGLVATRLRRAGLPRQDPTAPYWVAMGAASITVLATTSLLTTAGFGQADGLRTATAWVGTCFWALASLLIPALAARSTWRHLVACQSLRFRPDLWMVVFPAGMYATAAMRLGRIEMLPVVEHAGAAAAWVATVAWALVFISMIFTIVSRMVTAT